MGGVLRKSKALYLARLHHSCVKNALLEMLTDVLQTKTKDALGLTELWLRRKAFIILKLDAIAIGGR